MKSALILFVSSIFRSEVALGLQTFKLPWWHPTLQYVADEYIAAPPGHPLLDEDEDFQGFIAYYENKNHRFFDGDSGFLYEPDGLPNNHPGLDQFFEPKETPYEDFPIVYWDHPDILENYNWGEPLPEGHPVVMDMLSDLLPSNHPYIDDLFQQHEDLPIWHIDISMILRIGAFPTYLPTSAPATEFGFVETEVHIEDDQPIAEDYSPEGDEINIEDNQQITEEEFPEEVEDNIGDDNIGNDQKIKEEDLPSESTTAESIPETVESMSIEVLPTDIPFSVYSGHPALVEEMIVPPFKHHPTVSHLFMAHQPPDHPNIDDLIEEGFTLPRWHPSISHMIAPRSLVASPGSLLCYALSALVVVALVLRNCKHWHNSKRSIEKSFPGKFVEKNIIDETRMSASDGHSTSDDGRSSPTFPPPDLTCDDGVEMDPLSSNMLVGVNSLPRLDQNHHNAMEISRMRNESDAEPVKSIIIAYREKRNTRLRTAWIKILGKRALGTHSSNGELVFCMFYVALNSLALLLSPYDLNVGFGSLAAGNIVFLVVSAIKNSVLTWFLGMAFDQVIVYHQFIGRVTVVTSFIHSCFYFNRLVEFMSDRVYKTGFIALMFGIFITISSLNWIRRKYFNVFYWSHIAFVGFIVCVFLHARGARPFIMVSVASYVVDKVLHMMWTQLPRKTLRIEPVGEGGKTTFVRISKTPLNQLLGRHKVGQWVVVNFPELSLTEWHPFSVASGPSQPFIDLYIRALGNHTKSIANYSEKCASENRQALIRVDGPYGNLSFNYRRYGSLVLVGGGIGITPLISIIKDIYEKGEAKQFKKLSHCMKNVHLIWIMPHEADAALFLEQLLIYRELSTHEPSLPLLEVSIHITREESAHKIESRPVFYTRPDIPQMMNECTAKAVEAGSSSILIFACGPGSMVNQVWDASMKKNSKRIRVDFHHESFAY
ncbi:hypothetical protein ACHAXA_004574 [Cyclostephanos tholiformis]|uniref:FAD-binding FR-type domain-containing protein n=1 Tax=Cyclostephanos tholiformis TaxID=382380 RepID=A0ABD3R2K0_9STRA